MAPARPGWSWWLLVVVVSLGSAACVAAAMQAAPASYLCFRFHEPVLIEIGLSQATIGQAAILALAYSLTAIVGYATLAPFYQGLRLPLGVRILASFFAGYLVLIAGLRLASLVTGPTGLRVFVLVAVPLLSWWRLRRWTCSQTEPAHPIKPTTFTHLAAGVGAFGLVMLLSLVQYANFGAFNWNGHGPEQYARHLREWNAQGLTHFPIIHQHYDELLFHFPLAAFCGETHPAAAWWLTLGMIKGSLTLFLFAAFRKAGLTGLESAAGSLFLILGTSSPLVVKYFLLFDSANPLFFVAHSGRLVGIGITTLFLAEQVSMRSAAAGLGDTRLDGWAWGSLALGLTSTSLSNSLWLVALAVLARCVPISGFVVAKNADRRTLILLCGLTSLACGSAVGLYGLPQGAKSYLVRFVLVASVAGLIAVVVFREWRATRTSEGVGSQKSPLWSIFSLTLCGTMLLGNLTVNNPLSRSLLGCLASTGHVVSQMPFNESLTQNTRHLPWIGDYRELGTHNEHSQSAGHFCAYYGVPMLLAGGAMLVAARRVTVRGAPSDRWCLVVLSLSAASLPLWLFFMDYVGVGNRAWIKSRFLENPVYTLMFVSVWFLATSEIKMVRWLLATGLIMLSIVPFVGTERPRQLAANATALLRIWQEPAR